MLETINRTSFPVWRTPRIVMRIISPGALIQKVKRHPVLVLLIASLPLFGWYGTKEAIVLVRLASAKQAIARGELEQARSILTDVLQARSPGAQARILAASTARRLGAYEEAERHLRAYEAKYGRTEAYTI